MDLRTGDVEQLPVSLMSPALGDGVLYAPGRAGAMIVLGPDGATEVDVVPHVNRSPMAPAATDGAHAVVIVEGRLELVTFGEATRPSWSIAARGWEPPALAWPWAAWATDQDGDEDLWWIDGAAGGDPIPLADGPGDQRLVVGSGHHFAWVEPGAVVVLDAVTGARTRHAADSGFSAAPSLWGSLVCWEDRAGGDVDITCSDGVAVGGPGHQRWPSRWDRWLVYRDGDTVMLYTAPDEPPGEPATDGPPP